MGPSTGEIDVEGEDRQRALFAAVAATGHWLFVHAEDGGLVAEGLRRHGAEGAAAWHLARSVEAETVATRRALRLAAECGTRLHVFHVSAGATVDLVEEARGRGQAVTAGTCPHYLYFIHEDVARVGALLRVNPSIKGEEDRQRLLEGLRSGAIDCLSSDHAPHTAEEKSKAFADAPSGIPCLDIYMPLCLTMVQRGWLSLETVLQRGSATPAKVHGFTTKGSVAPGKDADLVLVDPHTPRVVRGAEHFSKARQTPYEGMELVGWPRLTMVLGQVVFRREGAAVR
jgi:dihydroorotase (multifunctional complex type)